MPSERPNQLLDAAVTYLVADPTATLSELAAAAGISRTTLFKRYPTRDDLIQAVADRAWDVCSSAVAEAARAADGDAADGGLRALVTALLPVGPQLSFLWRTPAVDGEDATKRQFGLDQQIHGIVDRAKAAGAIRPDVLDVWVPSALYALVYSAWELVEHGHVARRAGPDLVLETLLRGIAR